jgi:hypothetical protein
MIILIILGSACFAFYMVNVIQWHKKNHLLDEKPFNCVTCLSGWTGFACSILSWHITEAPFILFISAVFGLILDNGVKRYL